MIRRYRTHHRLQPSQSPKRTALRWWHPLTQCWGQLGVIIFIGLVMSVIDGSGRWHARQSVPMPGGQVASASATQLEQSSPQPRAQAARPVR
jgi:hypothetical protein